MDLIRTWRDVAKEECDGYHFIDLPDGEVFEGQWDLRGRMPDYIGNFDVSGKRVIDIGCASGFLSFEMERLGASEVVSFDADDHRRIANIPVLGSQYVDDRAEWGRNVDAFLNRLKNGYWYAHKRLGSKNACLYGDIYDIPAPNRHFDVAVVGQILVHLRDPITALSEAARVARDTLIITEGVYDSPDAAGVLHASNEAGGPPYIWWLLSVEAYRRILPMFGFEVHEVKSGSFNCVTHEYVQGEMDVTTIIAHRTRG